MQGMTEADQYCTTEVLYTLDKPQSAPVTGGKVSIQDFLHQKLLLSLQLLISDLIVCSVSGLVLLQLLLPLPELPFRVADVATEAVGVEVVVAARLGERLSLLKTPGMNRSMNCEL